MADARTLTFPTLMWHKDTGQELTAHSLAEHVALVAKGYVDTPPGSNQRTNAEPVKPPRPIKATRTTDDGAVVIDQAARVEDIDGHS